MSLGQFVKPGKTLSEETRKNKRLLNGFHSAFIDGLIFNNLSLVDFVGLTPIIAGGSTVHNGLVLGTATLILLVCVTPFAATVGRRIPNKFAPAVYTLISAVLVAIMGIVGYAVIPNVMVGIGIVFPLVAVNGITLNRIRHFSGRSMSATIGDALGKGLGFTLVILFVSAIREVLGYGTFMNMAVPFFKDRCIPLMAGVPAGFFIMAVLAWIINLIGMRLQRGRNIGKEMEK